MKLKYTIIIVIIFVAFGVGIGIGYTACEAIVKTDESKKEGLANSRLSKGISVPDIMLQPMLRRLWADHVMYTAMLMRSSLDDLDDLESIAQRLMLNQIDISEVFGHYLGKDFKKDLEKLLMKHIDIAIQYVDATKYHKSSKARIDKEWIANADSLALLFARKNPKTWNFRRTQEMFRTHLEHNRRYLNARLRRTWKQVIEELDSSMSQAMEMADLFTKGLLM